MEEKKHFVELDRLIVLKLARLNELWKHNHVKFEFSPKQTYCCITVMQNGNCRGIYCSLFYDEQGGIVKTYEKVLKWVEDAIHGTFLTEKVVEKIAV